MSTTPLSPDFKTWLAAQGLPLRFLGGPTNDKMHAERLLRSPDSLTRDQRDYLQRMRAS